jgi:hypothetical protein
MTQMKTFFGIEIEKFSAEEVKEIIYLAKQMEYNVNLADVLVNLDDATQERIYEHWVN